MTEPKSVYVIICERTDEPCAAEVQAFSTKDAAKAALKTIFDKSKICFDLTCKQVKEAEASFKEHNEESFVIELDEDDGVHFYCRIEILKIKD